MGKFKDLAIQLDEDIEKYCKKNNIICNKKERTVLVDMYFLGFNYCLGRCATMITENSIKKKKGLNITNIKKEILSDVIESKDYIYIGNKIYNKKDRKIQPFLKEYNKKEK